MAISGLQKSTIVRSLMRAGLGGLEHAYPALGARVAHRLWFRLPSAVVAPAPTFDGDVDARPVEVDVQGRTVRGRVWGEGPVVYLVHGWAGAADQLTPFVAPLVAAGFTVVSFDGLSHGRSDAGQHGARSSDAVELARALGAVHARFGPAHAIVAHSMGTLSTMLALRDGWVATDRLVLIAPVTGVADFIRRIRKDLGFGDRTQTRLEALALARTGYAVADLDVTRLAGQVERPQLLVVHDEADRETPHAGSLRLVSTWDGAELLTTTGLGHRRILADPDVGAAVARFVVEDDARLGAGSSQARRTAGSGATAGAAATSRD